MLPLIRSLVSSTSSFITSTSPGRMISTTNVCFAEPMKKRKKVDLEILKIRQDRKIKKLEREIRRMKKIPKQLKPIEEYVLPPRIMKEVEKRTRKNDPQEVQQLEANIEKMLPLWTDYKSKERKMQMEDMKHILRSQAEALETLAKIDKELYLNAIAKDPSMDHLVDDQMVTETPANPEFKTKDGKRTDISKNWFM